MQALRHFGLKANLQKLRHSCVGEHDAQQYSITDTTSTFYLNANKVSKCHVTQ